MNAIFISTIASNIKNKSFNQWVTNFVYIMYIYVDAMHSYMEILSINSQKYHQLYIHYAACLFSIFKFKNLSISQYL